VLDAVAVTGTPESVTHLGGNIGKELKMHFELPNAPERAPSATARAYLIQDYEAKIAWLPRNREDDNVGL
jgi:hypothetical protein